jgi:hypothetical protein
MITNLLITLMNIIHLIIIFLPLFIFYLPRTIINKYLPLISLITILIPSHWDLFDNKCIFTIFTKELGGLENTTTTSQFSEIYMRWFYEPLIMLFGGDWNSDNLELAVILHWIVNLIIIWYYIFFVYCKK